MTVKAHCAVFFAVLADLLLPDAVPNGWSRSSSSSSSSSGVRRDCTCKTECEDNKAGAEVPSSLRAASFGSFGAGCDCDRPAIVDLGGIASEALRFTGEPVLPGVGCVLHLNLKDVVGGELVEDCNPREACGAVGRGV